MRSATVPEDFFFCVLRGTQRTLTGCPTAGAQVVEYDLCDLACDWSCCLVSPGLSHELPVEPRTKVVPGPGKHSVYTHFAKDRNCDICLQTKITRASCRGRTGTVVPKAENFGELLTADHKVLSEGCESRHNHR